MLPDLGHVAIVIGLAVSVYAVLAFAVGARRRDTVVVHSARRAVLVSFVLAGIAATIMVISLLTHDFSVLYVARNNATTTPPFFSVISLWAALEGSILFWTLLAAGWATLVLYRYRGMHPQLMPWVGATLAAINVFLFSVMTWPGNPFTRVTPLATEGPGPNALLQNHPFMGLHPPLLYLGYTGLAIPFAFGIAALITRRTDDAWLSIVRRWTIVPWIFLTAGIVAGAWWSYEVLGWGGYWAWDPVENAALLPWLTATAFIHSSMVAERRGGLRTWSAALVICTFVLTIFGTFLTRSGVVASVHSFTQSAIGPWYLAGILIALGASSVLLVARLPDLRDRDTPTAVVSRESAFLFNNVLFLVITAVVILGTLLPLGVQLFGGETIVVGAPWFNRVNVPLFVALLFLMGVGPALPWGGASLATLRDRFGPPLLVAAVAMLAAWALGMRALAPLATLGMALFSGGSVTNGAGSTLSGGSYGIYVEGGAATVSNAGAITGDVELDGGVDNDVTLYTGSSIDGNLYINNRTGSTLTFDGTGTQLLSDAVTGSFAFGGQLIKQGSGTWIIDKNLLADHTAVTQGGLVVGVGGSGA